MSETTGQKLTKLYLCKYSNGTEVIIPLKYPQLFTQMEGDHLLSIERIKENDYTRFDGT